jgi:hypothetical protein
MPTASHAAATASAHNPPRPPSDGCGPSQTLGSALRVEVHGAASSPSRHFDQLARSVEAVAGERCRRIASAGNSLARGLKASVSPALQYEHPRRGGARGRGCHRSRQTRLARLIPLSGIALIPAPLAASMTEPTVAIRPVIGPAPENQIVLAGRKATPTPRSACSSPRPPRPAAPRPNVVVRSSRSRSARAGC